MSCMFTVANRACLSATRSNYSRSVLGFKSYLISVNVSDNSSPVQWALSQFTLVVESTNDFPPKSGSKTVVVNTLNGVFNDVPLGNVNVDDPDDWDLSDETFSFDSSQASAQFFTWANCFDMKQCSIVVCNSVLVNIFSWNIYEFSQSHGQAHLLKKRLTGHWLHIASFECHFYHIIHRTGGLRDIGSSSECHYYRIIHRTGGFCMLMYCLGANQLFYYSYICTYLQTLIISLSNNVLALVKEPINQSFYQSINLSIH